MYHARKLWRTSQQRESASNASSQRRLAGHFIYRLLALLAISLCGPLRAAPPGYGDTYDEAVSIIPFDRLTDEAQGKLWRIVSQPSLYRRLPRPVRS